MNGRCRLSLRKQNRLLFVCCRSRVHHSLISPLVRPRNRRRHYRGRSFRCQAGVVHRPLPILLQQEARRGLPFCTQVQEPELGVPFFPGEEGVVCCICVAQPCLPLSSTVPNDNDDVYAANVHTVTGGQENLERSHTPPGLKPLEKTTQCGLASINDISGHTPFVSFGVAWWLSLRTRGGGKKPNRISPRDPGGICGYPNPGRPPLTPVQSRPVSSLHFPPRRFEVRFPQYWINTSRPEL